MKHIESTHSLTFEQIQAVETTHPEHTFRAKFLIKHYISYVPTKEKCIPQLPYIQTLMELYKTGKMDYETYYKELEAPIRLIRNHDLGNIWWVTKQPFDDYDYDCYNQELAHSRERARTDLSELLDYEPELIYSLHSEMILRRLYQADIGECEEYYNTRFFAMSSAIYRQILLKDGKEEADASPLVGQMLYKDVGLCPITGKPLVS